jgi:hypothetical protein
VTGPGKDNRRRFSREKRERSPALENFLARRPSVGIGRSWPRRKQRAGSTFLSSGSGRARVL